MSLLLSVSVLVSVSVTISKKVKKFYFHVPVGALVDNRNTIIEIVTEKQK